MHIQPNDACNFQVVFICWKKGEKPHSNWDCPANRLETSREPVDEVTTWIGFDGEIS